MKTIIILIALFITTPAFSEVYVYTDTSSDEVLFITEKKDAVVIDDAAKDSIVETVLPKTLEYYDLTEKYSDYKLSGGRFILNTQKISDRENAVTEATAATQKKIEDFESAKIKLMNKDWVPLTLDEVESLK